MSKSMTGYGKAVAQLSNGSLTVEIRTLNAKNADINLKSSLLPKDKELLLRQKIAQSLQMFFSAGRPTEAKTPAR